MASWDEWRGWNEIGWRRLRTCFVSVAEIGPRIGGGDAAATGVAVDGGDVDGADVVVRGDLPVRGVAGGGVPDDQVGGRIHLDADIVAGEHRR